MAGLFDRFVGTARVLRCLEWFNSGVAGRNANLDLARSLRGCLRFRRFSTSGDSHVEQRWEGLITSRVQELLKGVREGNRASLAEAITLGKGSCFKTGCHLGSANAEATQWFASIMHE